MSKIDDERRLYRCARKYEKIIKQFEALIEVMNSGAKPPKRRRNTKGNRNATATAFSNQPDNNEEYVQTLTTFIQELRANSPADAACSTSTTSP